MPLCNRVTPWGEVVAHPARYPAATAVFGNRGVLHDAERKVDRTRKTQRDDNRAFNGRKRVLMTPRRYTELFFLDEPTAFAAGHRPCGCCRRDDFKRFMATWAKMHPRREPWTAAAVDAVLHSERLSGGAKARHVAALSELPAGAMVSLEGQTCDAWLLWDGDLHLWSHDGYQTRRSVTSLGKGLMVEVLTPRSMVEVLRSGFEHGLPDESARRVHQAGVSPPPAELSEEADGRAV